jgi:hypothetical protein
MKYCLGREREFNFEIIKEVWDKFSLQLSIQEINIGEE